MSEIKPIDSIDSIVRVVINGKGAFAFYIESSDEYLEINGHQIFRDQDELQHHIATTSDAYGERRSLLAYIGSAISAPSSPSLVIDSVRDILRFGGQEINIARKFVIKRMLYLMAATPNSVFSKEKLSTAIQRREEYHPFRHDSAVFTNVMRARQLFGTYGADIIRIHEDGYVFVPPKDFLFI